MEEDPAAVGALIRSDPGHWATGCVAVEELEASDPDRLVQTVMQRCFDSLPEAVALARNQRHRDARTSGERRIRRGDRHSRVDRLRSVRHQRSAVRPHAGRGDALPAGDRSAIIIGRKSRQREIDQSIVVVGRLLRPEAKSIHDARPEVLHDHIGRCDQFLRRAPSISGLQIQGDSPLAPVPDRVRRRVPHRTRRWIYANHVGTVVGEHHRRQRTRHVLTEIDDTKPVERAHIRLHRLSIQCE